MSALHLSACYYRRELAPGWALLVLDTALIVLFTIEQSTHGWAVGSVEVEEAAAYLAAHEGEERMMRQRQPRRPAAAPLLHEELSRAKVERMKRMSTP